MIGRRRSILWMPGYDSDSGGMQSVDIGTTASQNPNRKMILNIKAKDICDGDYVLIGESDYRVFPLWVMIHSANYAGRRLQISTGVGIVKRRYAERIIVWRYDCFEEQRRIQLESGEERAKRTRWYEENIVERYRHGGYVDSKGFIRPVSYPQKAVDSLMGL